MTVAETVDWIEERTRGVLSDAWHQARLNALAKTKKFPKSPADLWKEQAPSDASLGSTLVASAKARKAAQEMDTRLKRMGKQRVIRRKE
ncbi:MAG: hypothetical protein ACYCZ0_01835 [Minisyncoccota bacterium]